MAAVAEAKAEALPVRRKVLHIEAGVTLTGLAAPRMSLEVLAPARLAESAVVLVCLPGGGMTRRYWDLPDQGGARFSFAQAMVARGFVVVMLDYLGIGDSDRPEDGWQLTPELLTVANSQVVDVVLRRLREGRLDAQWPALPELRSIGVGHSMGAMMTVLHQASSAPHAAIAVLGFSTRGLPQYLPPQAPGQDHSRLRGEAVSLARLMFDGQAYPSPVRKSMSGTDLYAGAAADPGGAVAIRAAMTHLLAVPALTSMLPGNVAAEAAAITVPVFIGLGERDMAGPTHAVPANFPASQDITLHVLPGAGHSHLLFAARAGLYRRFAAWAQDITNSITN